MRFITIRCSHYVERARWALDLAGLPYEEESSPPVLHFMRTLAERPAGSKTHTVPMLLTPDSGLLTDSAAIVAYAASHSPVAKTLYPEDPALLKEVQDIEQQCSQRLGAFTRVVVYQQLCKDSSVFFEVLAQGAPAWQRRMFWVMFWPIRTLIIKGMGINDVNAEKCRGKILAMFEELGARLQGPGGGQRKYLVGETFTAADLTFASLASLVVLPEQYGGRLAPNGFGALAKVFDAKLLAQMRDTAAGRHVLEMYRLHRLPDGSTAGGGGGAAARRGTAPVSNM